MRGGNLSVDGRGSKRWKNLSLGVTVQGLYGEGLPLMLYERPPSGVLKLIVDVLLLYMRILEP